VILFTEFLDGTPSPTTLFSQLWRNRAIKALHYIGPKCLSENCAGILHVSKIEQIRPIERRQIGRGLNPIPTPDLTLDDHLKAEVGRQRAER